MALSKNVIDQFAKLTNIKTKDEGSTVKGTYKKIDGVDYVQLDGSDILTPVNMSVDAETNERVSVLIKDHMATLVENITSPAARSKSVTDLEDTVDEFGNTIQQMDNTIIQQNNSIIQMENTINQQNNTINQHDNKINQQGDEIVSINNTLLLQGNAIEATNNTVEAHGTQISTMNDTINSQGNNIDIMNNTLSAYGNRITANENNITAQGNTITAQGNTINAQGSSINILNSAFVIDNGVLKGLSQIVVDDLETNSLNAKYANIDFSNIGEAAVEKLFTESGIIADLVMSEGKVTGHLVGVTITGDLIEGNTVKADKLVIQGEDGLYYKLNVNALGETTASSDAKYQNGLDGSVIVADSITAEKIAVDDLVAFGATIGGYHITDHSLYSGAKASVNNTTKGVFLGDDGQINIGDNNNYLKFYNDNGQYKLELKANSIVMGTSTKTVEETIIELNDQIENIELTPGPQGPQGPAGAKGNGINSITYYYAVTTSQTAPAASSITSTTIPSMSATNKYLWQKEVIDFTDSSVADKTTVLLLAVYGNTGSQGPQGNTGPQGPQGTAGKGISSIKNHYLTSDKIKFNITWDGDTTDKSHFTDPGFDQNGNPAGTQFLYKISDLIFDKPSLIGATLSIYASNTTQTRVLTETDITETDRFGSGAVITLWWNELVFIVRKATSINGRDVTPGTYFQGSSSSYVSGLSHTGTTLADEGWTEEIQTPTVTKKYLWSYQETTYTDSTKLTTEPCVIGVYGDTGEDAVIPSTTAPLDTSKIWLNSNDNMFYMYKDNDWIVINDIGDSLQVLQEQINNVDNQINDALGAYNENVIKTTYYTKSEVDTAVVTKANALNIEFTNKTTTIETTLGNTTKKVEDMSGYIHTGTEDGVTFLELGNVSSDFKVRIENDSMSILYKGNPVTQWEQNLFEVETVISKMLRLGKFSYVVNDDESLSFRKVD